MGILIGREKKKRVERNGVMQTLKDRILAEQKRKEALKEAAEEEAARKEAEKAVRKAGRKPKKDVESEKVAGEAVVETAGDAVSEAPADVADVVEAANADGDGAES